MAVPLTGSGSIFLRVGTLGHLLGDVNSHLGTAVPSDAQGIMNQYTSAEDMIDGMAQAVAGYQEAAIWSWLQQTAQNTVVEMVNADVRLPDSTLETAMVELIRQMNASGAVVKSCAVGLAVTADSRNTCDGQIAYSLKSATGVQLDDAYQEKVEVTVTADAITGGASLGRETIQFAGGAAVTNQLSYLWPGGSGGSVSLQAVDAYSDDSRLLSNGSFEDWTGNAPDSWTLTTGSAGGTVFKETTTVYAASACLRVLGNGSENTCLRQEPSEISAINQYAANFWLRLSGAAAAGVFEISLVDADTGLYISDQAGTQNRYQVSLPGLAAPTVFTPFQAVFRTPLLLASAAQVQLKLTTPLTNGVSLYLDHLGLGVMQNQYPSGPWWLAFSGKNQFTQLDRFYGQVANDYGGRQQTLWNRLMGMAGFGGGSLLLPASGTPNIPDTF